MEIENNDLVKVLKWKKTYDDDTIILCAKPLETFFGRCDETNVLIKLGSLEDSVFNGNTNLSEISEENIKNRYVYIGGDKKYCFVTNDHIPKKFSKMGNNMIPYSIATGEENVYLVLFITKIQKE